MIRFWLHDCPACCQGRVFAEVRDDTGELIFECEECYRACKSPDESLTMQNAFLAIEIASHPATEKEIALAGWSGVGFRIADD